MIVEQIHFKKKQRNTFQIFYEQLNFSRLPELVLEIRAGTPFRNSFGVVHFIEKKFEHPSFNSETVDYDITVLRLTEPLPFSAAIGSIPLPQPNAPLPVGEPSVVAGWGAIQEGGPPVDLLQAVRVPVVSLEECRAAYGEDTVTDRMLCAGVPEGGKDACQVIINFSQATVCPCSKVISYKGTLITVRIYTILDLRARGY